MTELGKRKRGRPRKYYPLVPIGSDPKPISAAEVIEPQPQDDLTTFEKFLNIVRGKTDVKSRVRLLLDPDKPQTSTYLTRQEVDFCSTAFFVAREFPMFEPLADFAEDFALTKISEQGHGVESVIRYENAMNENKPMNQFSFGLAAPEGKHKEVKEKGKEEKS